MRRKQIFDVFLPFTFANTLNDQIKALDFFKRPANAQIECKAKFSRIKNVDILGCPSRHGSFLAQNLEMQHFRQLWNHIIFYTSWVRIVLYFYVIIWSCILYGLFLFVAFKTWRPGYGITAVHPRSTSPLKSLSTSVARNRQSSQMFNLNMVSDVW